MVSSAMLMWSILFGSIGIAYLVYGRKQRHVLALVTGLLLIVFPYFISNVMLLVSLGVLLVALPYIISKLNF
ncbi:MAG TPA: hypothetical protein ENI64_13035 [Gammaproteobacteria bacterium]|nr:hypothetical protein [Gammaproteobacteria bacterium]